MANSIKISEIEEAAATIKTDAEIQTKFGVSKTYIWQRCKANAEFKAAYGRGRLRFGQSDEPALEIEVEEAEITEDEITEETKDKKDTLAVHLRSQIILAIMKKYDNLEDIAKYLGEEKKAVYSVLMELVAENKVEKYYSDDLVFYKLPDAENEVEEKQFSLSEVQKKILFAIDNHYLLESQIVKFTKLKAVDVSFALLNLIDEQKLKAFKQQFTFYVRRNWQPQRVWLDGTGKCGIEFADSKSKKSTFNGPSHAEPKQAEKIVEPELVEPELVEVEMKITPVQEIIKVEKIEDVEVNPRFKETLEHISDNGHSKESIEAVKKSISESVEKVEINVPKPETIADKIIPSSHQVNFQEINLDGGRLMIGFDGNIFGMDSKSRSKLNEIIDLVQELK